MKSSDEIPDLGQLNYPVYVAAIFKAPEIELELFGCILLAYKVEDRYMCFDCLPKIDWKSKNCRLTYEERLCLLRQTLSETADYTKYFDLPYQVSNPVQLLDFYKEALTNDYRGVKIYDIDGKYEFGDTITNTYFELIPKEIIIQ